MSARRRQEIVNDCINICIRPVWPA